jgi:hypothetical protein
MKKRMLSAMIGALVAITLAGCGGGGSGGDGGAPVVTSHGAQLLFRTEGVLPTGNMSGIGVTLELPATVSVKKSSSGMVDAGVVSLSGVTAGKASLLTPVYTAASGSVAATLSFVLSSSDAAGFGVGEFAKVTLDVPGALPVAADFKIKSFSPVDLATFSAIPTGPGKLEAKFTANIY